MNVHDGGGMSLKKRTKKNTHTHQLVEIETRDGMTIGPNEYRIYKPINGKSRDIKTLFKYPERLQNEENSMQK